MSVFTEDVFVIIVLQLLSQHTGGQWTKHVRYGINETVYDYRINRRSVFFSRNQRRKTVQTMPPDRQT